MQKLEPFDLILFGGTGDLAMRKLMPALYRRVSAGQIVQGSRIIAVARSNHTREGFIGEVEAKCRPHLSEGEFTEEHWQAFVALVDYLPVKMRPCRKTPIASPRNSRAARIGCAWCSCPWRRTCSLPPAKTSVAPSSSHPSRASFWREPLGQDRAFDEAINQLVGSIFA